MASRIPLRGGRERGDAYRHRGSARQRGYSTTYQKARELVLGRNPLCRVCQSQGVTREAVETHHVVPVQADRYLADDARNLLPVCCACHDAIEGMSWAQLHTAYGIEQW